MFTAYRQGLAGVQRYVMCVQCNMTASNMSPRETQPHTDHSPSTSIMHHKCIWSTFRGLPSSGSVWWIPENEDISCSRCWVLTPLLPSWQLKNRWLAAGRQLVVSLLTAWKLSMTAWQLFQLLEIFMVSFKRFFAKLIQAFDIRYRKIWYVMPALLTVQNHCSPICSFYHSHFRSQGCLHHWNM